MVMAVGLVSDVIDDASICSDDMAEAFTSIDMTKTAEDTTGESEFASETEGCRAARWGQTEGV